MNLKSHLSDSPLPGKKLILVALIALQTISCNIINPDEPVPAYVHIDSFTLTTDSSTQGSNSSNIADAWVYVDGNVIGTFELPVTFPVLSSGSHKLTIRPGILIDGIASTRAIYPFYTGFDTIVNFESAKTVNAIPKITYSSTANVTHTENFENLPVGISNLVRQSVSDTSMLPVQNQHSFEGVSGGVFLDADHDFFEYAWKDSFLLPHGRPAYVELNYKTDNEFAVGVISYTASGTYTDDIVFFRASATWKKQYVSLGPVINNTNTATGFKIYIKASKDVSLTTASLYFDNIKVVY